MPSDAKKVMKEQDEKAFVREVVSLVKKFGMTAANLEEANQSVINFMHDNATLNEITVVSYKDLSS